MKNRSLSFVLIIILGVILILVGFCMDYKNVSQVEIQKENTESVEVHKDYKELGPQSLKDDQIFDSIKYTQNHLSTTSNEYASFTSVVFNQTGSKIMFQKLEIDFYDVNNNLIATMPSEIENLDPGASMVIFAVVEKDLTKANTFKVRQVQ